MKETEKLLKQHNIVVKMCKTIRGRAEQKGRKRMTDCFQIRKPLLLTKQMTPTAHTVKTGKSKQIRFMKEV